MKLKTDFVTNSSSTSFIVVIPAEFNLRDHLSISENAGIIDNLMAETDRKYFKAHPDMYKIPTIEDLEEVFEKVKQKQFAEVCNYDDDVVLYHMVASLCQQLNLVLKRLDSGPDDGAVFMISESLIHERMNKFYGKIHD